MQFTPEFSCMDGNMKSTWNERYDVDDCIYGLEPNVFFAQTLEPKYRGKLLLPGEGEGRNAFYAASIGWDVHAFDISEVAAAKAMALARLNRFVFEYEINDCENFEIVQSYYDAIALIYFHLPPLLRKRFHGQIAERIKPGGMVFGELFSTEQQKYNSGGPKKPELLYTLDNIREDFRGLTFTTLEEKIVNLNEGTWHQGPAAVIRFVAVREC